MFPVFMSTAVRPSGVPSVPENSRDRQAQETLKSWGVPLVETAKKGEAVLQVVTDDSVGESVLRCRLDGETSPILVDFTSSLCGPCMYGPISSIAPLNWSNSCPLTLTFPVV